jgi:hypothetical protein
VKVRSPFLFAAISVSLSCGGGQTTARQPTERVPIRNIVRPRATYELHCPSEQVQITEVGHNNFAARGCGADTVYVCVGSMGMFSCRRDGEVHGLAPADGGAQPPVPGTLLTTDPTPVRTIVRPRAANDLHCDAAALQMYEIGNLTYVARGCNADALYSCTGSMGMYQCERN